MQLPKKLLYTATIGCLTATTVFAQKLPPGVGQREMRLYAQILAMSDTRQLDTALIDRALAESWPALRAAATLAIGQVGAERAMPRISRLRALLSDKDVSVAANAAYAIGLLRDSASIAALSTALSANHEVAREAAWAMGEIGAPARHAITTALATSRDTDVTVQVVLAAAKLRPVPLPEIRPLLRQGAPAVVWAASYAIARTRSPGGVRELLDLEASPSLKMRQRPPERRLETAPPYTDPLSAPPRTRAEIARGLAKSAAGDSLGASALAALSRLVGDVDPHVRVNAVRSLGTYGAIAKASLIYATRDADPNVRIAAAQSFGTVLSRESTEFPALWTADTSVAYRASLLASAARAGLRPQQLTQLVSSGDWRMRAAVAGAEGDTLDRTCAMSRAIPLTRDPDPRVREAAYAALLPPSSMPLEDAVHALLLTGLRDPDFYVRATVIGALADRPSSADLAAVLASYTQAARDSANDARLAAIQYVAALWKRDSSSVTPAQRAQLAALAVPFDPLERAAGKAVPAWERWKRSAPTPRPIAWYDGVVRTIVAPTLSGKPVTATINTVRGPVKIELFGAEAPITVWNFLSLARSGYYRNTRFHRVVPNFVAQDGDPSDDGHGGRGSSIRDG